MAEPSRNQIAKVVEAFVNATKWGECKSNVEAQRDQQLTDDADHILAILLKRYKDDAKAVLFLEECRVLLARCRCDGIEAAFANYLQPVELLKSLLSEIDHLSSLKDMSRRLELCRTALRLVNRDAQPQLWVALQYELANILHQNPQEERSDNLEQALLHCEQAFQVYTRQAFPEQWAKTQNNIAIAYRQRIRGERAYNLERAFSCFEQALGVRTPISFPQNCWDSAYALRYLLYNEHRFSEARPDLSIAHQAIEALRKTVQRIITEFHLEQVRLATLGACLSGRAALQHGDEHVGLMQAMLTTCVQVVVVSLWPVDDAATRAFFETFYARLVAGRSPVNAMQEAARFVREHPGWAHPFY